MEAKKSTSIMLAVGLGFWSWLYTFKKNAWKFWIGLGLNMCAVLASVALFVHANRQAAIERSAFHDSPDAGAYFMFGALSLSVLILLFFWAMTWVWAVIDAVASKK